MQNRTLAVGAILASTLGLCATAQADDVFVNNYSFEDVTLADGTNHVGDTMGWTVTSGTSVGIFNPTTALFPNGVTRGENAGYAYQGILSQLTDATFMEEYVYTLMVDVGWRVDLPELPDFQIQLVVDGVVVATASEAINPIRGEFETVTLQYAVQAGDPLAGGNIEIRLGSPESMLGFDNVRLSYTAIPSPGSLALLAVAGAVLRRRRRRA